MTDKKNVTMRVRLISIAFIVLALAIFKPLGLTAWHWEAYLHVLAFGVTGLVSSMITELVLKHLLHLPQSSEHGLDYIFRRNLWFQLINTPLVSLLICLYRHFVLGNRVTDNLLSWGNYLETLVIIAFCSFAVGCYWRFRFHSQYLSAELEEARLLNEQLQQLQQEHSSAANDSPDLQQPTTITLTGNTSDSLTLQVSDLLYIESVGNYVKVVHLRDGGALTNMLRATSHQMEEALQDYPLVVRCHRAFLVNLALVERIDSRSGTMRLIMMHNHDVLPVSRSNMAHIRQAFKEL